MNISSHYYSFADINVFDPVKYFEDKDYWVEITADNSAPELDTTNDENKTYYIVDYTIADYEDRDKKRSFIVAEEQFSEEEIKKLEPYCRCQVCIAPFFSLKRWTTCRCCVGCLQSGELFVRDYTVKKARKYYNEYNKINLK